MRFTSVFFFSCVLAVTTVACRDDHDDDAYGTVSGVVFGIEQRTDPSTGRTVTTAGYEYRFVGWENFSNGHWVSNAYALGAEQCARLRSEVPAASQHVGDGGRARFTGGALPSQGLVVDANHGDATWDGAALAAGPRMLFTVESGYGIPRFAPVEVPIADVTMRVAEPADVPEIAIDGSKEMRVAWTGATGVEGRVIAIFAPDDGSDPLRCYFDIQHGGSIAAASLRGLGPGKLTISSQRKIVVTPGDKWMVDVVTTNVVREQRYVVR